ncbi:MAG: hypothetical protein QNL62_10410 [Gammaproteobacteria bacterium]|nr:hypothetical protein [Gammaproteobacteria bacterium]
MRLMIRYRTRQNQGMRRKSVSLCILPVLVVLLVSISASASEGGANKKTIPATIIHFSEYEQGTEHTPVSMMVTSDFLRIDDNIDDSGKGKGFILFNRKEKMIYSVNAEDQQIIKISSKPVTIKPPMELKLHTVEMARDKKAPLIAGRQTQHHQFFVNDKLCYDLLSVPGLMPDVVTALKNFNQVLAGQQAEKLNYIPADVHDACDLAKHTFYPQRYLEKGFPLLEQEMAQAGQQNATAEEIKYSRTLVNYKQQEVLPELFVLPTYQIITIN